MIYNDGTLSPTPLSFNYTYHADGYAGAYDDISMTVTANYGSLSLSTSGDAQSSSQTGAFTDSSTYIGGDSVSGFTDYITASQNMDVGFTYQVRGQSGFQANADGGTYSNVTTDYSFLTESGGEDFALNGTKTYQGTVHLLSGTAYKLFVGLGWDSSAYSNDLNSNYSSYFMSADGMVTLKALSAGTLSSLSGHDYSPVPLPSSVKNLTLGILLLSVVLGLNSRSCRRKNGPVS